MYKSQLDMLCGMFAPENVESKDKWKYIKFIYIENPIVDVQKKLKRNEISYINNIDTTPGFYIIDTPESDFGVADAKEKVVTFIPLSIITHISFINSEEGN